MNLPEGLTPHTVQIRDRIGTGPSGELFGNWREVPRCAVEDKRKILIDPTGAQVVASTRIFIRPEFGPLPLHSEIRIRWGTPEQRVVKIEQVTYYDHAPAPTYYEVYAV